MSGSQAKAVANGLQEDIGSSGSRSTMGILLADLNSRRLIEGIAAQLELTPLLLTAKQATKPEALATMELLIADAGDCR